MSFPMHKPYDQPRYPSNQRNPSSSFHPSSDFAIDHRTTFGSYPPGPGYFHITSIRGLSSPCVPVSPFSSPFTNSPPSSHNPTALSSFYPTYSRAYDNTSSTDCLPQQGRDDASFNPSNNSSRPSTGSTGAVDSNTQVQSLSRRRSESPDISTQALSREQDPSSPSNPSKTYAFVSLPGTTIRKRPRKRYDEIERLYHCSWPDCTKSYGTLNHLNAHVAMQKHGPERLPSGEHPLISLPLRILTARYSEFNELRKQWRKELRKSRSLEVHDFHPRVDVAGDDHPQYS